jgi:predicted 2-oxoglutarate/Fe(II)-dependent dioxygenase YbiX
MELDTAQPYILTVARLLSPSECRELIARIEREGPTTAPITTLQGPRLQLDVRNNERVMFDDERLAAELFNRVKERVPQEILGMRLVGANERFRCYRYQPGMRFAFHEDGAFYRDEYERSCYSFLVYLNEDFEGGNTTFFVEPEVSIRPEAGMALLFQHPIVHEGCEVTSGVKYVVRTDLMYRRPIASASQGANAPTTAG